MPKIALTGSSLATGVPTYTRPGITAPDADASKLPLLTMTSFYGTAAAVRVGAVCDTPNATITVVMIFLDPKSNPMASTPVIFRSSPTVTSGAMYIGIPSEDPCWPAAGTSYAIVAVTAVGGGTWTVSASPR